MTCRSWIVSLVTLLAVSPDSVAFDDHDQLPTPAPARLSGLVVTAEPSPQPVRRAIVSLSGGNRPLGYHAVTDDEGRFAFAAVPAGRYGLAATRPSFVSIAYGATRPGRSGTAISLEPGQVLADVRLLLARGAVVSGTVRDASGAPISNLEVRVQPLGSPVTSAPTATVITDDRGRYRAFGLPGGTYVAVARPNNVSGGVELRSDADVDKAFAMLRQRRPAAASPATVTQAAKPVPPKSVSFAHVYHPSALTPDDATAIAVTAGEDRSGIDITLRWMSTWSISGSVVTPDVETRALIRPILKTVSAHSAPIARSATLAPDGTFQFPNVQPGRYTLEAQALSAEARRASIGAPDGRAVGPCAFASEDVLVTASDVAGLSLVMRPCLKMAGRIIATGAGTDLDISKVEVALMQLGPPPRPEFVPVRRLPPVIAMDGTFTLGEFGELLPGAYQFAVQVPGAAPGRGYLVQSAVADGRDILDTPLPITGDSPAMTSVVLTLTDRHTQLSGVLETPARQPAVNFTVIAFTTNRDWWTPPFRRIKTARPATDGHFSFQDLPPGEYYLAAMTDFGPDDVRDTALLSQAVSTAIRVTIGEGEQKVQNLRIAGGS